MVEDRCAYGYYGVEVYVENSAGSVVAYYDGDATLMEIVSDIEANKLEISKIEYYKKASVDGFIITVK